MSVWIWNAGDSIGFGFFQGATTYHTLRGGLDPQATETNVQWLARASFTLSNLYVRVTVNNGTQTVRLRKNAANVTQVVSVTGTGVFEDTTHTDAIVSGDLLATLVTVGGSHNNACTLSLTSYLANDNGANETFCQSSLQNSVSTDAYFSVGDGGANTVTEALAQVPIYVATTYSNLRLIVTAHGASVDTFETRINGVTGTQALSFGSGETATKEDVVNTDAVVEGDLLNYQLTTTSSMTLRAPAMAAAATGDSFLLAASVGAVTSPGASQTLYYVCGETFLTGTTTEANAQLKARTAQTLRNLSTSISANTRSDSTTIDLRVNGASSVLTVSVAAAATGILTDLTHSVTLATTDLINFRLVTGAGTGTLTPRSFGVQQGGAAAAVAVALPTFPLWRTRAPLYVR